MKLSIKLLNMPLIFLAILSMSFSLTNYANEKADSLLLKLIHLPNNEKAEVYNELFTINFETDILLAREYAEKALNFSDRYKDNQQKAIATRNLGIYYSQKANYSRAIQYYFLSLEIFEEQNEKTEIARNYVYLGNVYFLSTNYPRALEYLLKSLDFLKNTDDYKLLARNYNQLGIVYGSTGDFGSSEKYFLKSLELQEKIKSTDDLIAVYNNLGYVNKLMNLYDSSIQYFTKAINKINATGVQKSLGEVLGNIAEVYVEKKDYKMAEEYFMKSLENLKSKENTNVLGNVFLNFAELYIQTNTPEQATLLIKQAHGVAIELNDNELLKNVFLKYSNYYESRNEAALAFSFFKKYDQLGDSIQTIINKKIQEDLQMISGIEHEILQKQILEKTEELEKSLNQNHQSQSWHFNHLILVISIFATLLLIFVLFQLRQRKLFFGKLNAKTKELQRYSLVAKQTDNSVMIMDSDGNFEWVNEGFEKLYGYKFEEFIRLKGNNLRQISSNPEIDKLFAECLLTKKSVTYPCQFPAKNGKLWFQTTLTPVLCEKGQVSKIVAIESNIDNLKKVEEEILKTNEELKLANERLKQSEAFLKAQSDELEKLSIVARATDNAVMIMDADANFEWVNEGFVQLYGYTFQEFIQVKGGSNLRKVSSSPNIDEILNECITEKKSMTYISHYNIKHGKLWMQTTITPIFDMVGKLSKIVAIVSNIDKIKKAEEEIKKTNEELQKAYEKLKLSEASLKIQSDELEKLSIVARETDNAVMIMDENANFEWVNEGFVRLYGYTFDEFIKAKGGTNLRQVSSAPNIKKILDECINNRNSMTYISHYNARYSKIWMQTTITPIFKTDGKLHKIVAIVSNIDKTKKAEEEIKKTNAELNVANEKLKEVNMMKDTFFSIVAHDLRSPLAGFQQITEILSLKFEKYTEEEKKNSINIMNNSAKQLFNLLENILQWSRIQSGKTYYNPGKFDLKKIVEDNIDLIKINAENKKIEIIDKTIKELNVYCDRNMIDTVIRNLLSNAIKFTTIGGKVEIITKIKEDFVEVEVKDNGVGISEENLSRLFRIDLIHSTFGTSNEKGTGIGLVLCKEFIEKNEGEIIIDSELGKGTSIKFTLQKFF